MGGGLVAPSESQSRTVPFLVESITEVLSRIRRVAGIRGWLVTPVLTFDTFRSSCSMIQIGPVPRHSSISPGARHHLAGNTP
eukprot:764743-Hanusia_phi.AAC.1